MPIYQDVAASVVRSNEDKLRGLSESQRKEFTKSILRKLSKKTDDELIQFITSRS